MTVRLTVIDQTPVHGDHPPERAPQLSVTLAQACEQWGYYRYWLAEHHGSPHFAGPAPEVLITRIAAATHRIRVGSGGVMLPHYSPYKVAEVFRSIAALFPDRIDLGIGRAPGGSQRSSAALAAPGQLSMRDTYPQQASDLVGFLRDGFSSGHPYAPLYDAIAALPAPTLWMLGSSGGTAALAGQLKMGLALAQFIAPDTCSPTIFDSYDGAWRDAHRPTQPASTSGPRLVALAVVCAPSDDEAQHLASTAAYRKFTAGLGGREPLLSPEAVSQQRLTMRADECAAIDAIRDAMVVGSPSTCRQRIESLAQAFGTEEIGIVTVTHAFNMRHRSYRLLAEAFDCI